MPTQYDREKNVNTPEYWDSAWGRNPEVGAEKAPVRARVVEIFGTIPESRVVEYGFGAPHLARLLPRGRWEGIDFSKVAVENARKEGFRATVGRCADSPGYRKAYLVALEVLEHLDDAEMREFLSRSRNAPHAFFSVPVETERDHGFHQHQRGFGGPDDFATFLREWWPHVEVETVAGRWMLAHATHQAPVKTPILTVGCSTLLDFYGVLYSFASLATHHGTFAGEVEFVVVDNHPEPTVRLKGCPTCAKLAKDGPECAECKKAVADMEDVATREGARYVRWAEKQGTYPGKDRLATEARGKWVLTMDSHVLLSPWTLDRVLEVISADPLSDDFFHFPCLFAGGRGAAAVDYRNQQWIYHGDKSPARGGVYGWTKLANTAGDPYPIAAMITSCYLVRKEAWRTARGYAPILGNYGGWEGPLQLKWWLMGRRVLSLRHSRQDVIDRHEFLRHWHLFCKPGTRLANQTGRVHTGATKQRNFAASSAVIGGEAWVRRHCELRGWNFGQANIQEGLRAGMELRPWMVENLARPEWEDIREFFAWMKAEGIPGALETW